MADFKSIFSGSVKQHIEVKLAQATGGHMVRNLLLDNLERGIFCRLVGVRRQSAAKPDFVDNELGFFET
jgi:hypothetical protein